MYRVTLGISLLASFEDSARAVFEKVSLEETSILAVEASRADITHRVPLNSGHTDRFVSPAFV
jgi:hypothetical protein